MANILKDEPGEYPVSINVTDNGLDLKIGEGSDMTRHRPLKIWEARVLAYSLLREAEELEARERGDTRSSVRRS